MDKVARLPAAERNELFSEVAAKPGSLRLIPAGAVLVAVEKDYRAMANMMFGEVFAFDDIMTTLQQLQDEINGEAT